MKVAFGSTVRTLISFVENSWSVHHLLQKTPQPDPRMWEAVDYICPVAESPD